MMAGIARRAALTGGRTAACRIAAVALLVLTGVVPLSAAGGRQDEPAITVSEKSGVFRVTAAFTVPQRPAFAMAILTDYPEIPRFMPEVRTSHVLERSENRTVVEQEVVARFLLFSKRVHLVLEVEQQPESVRFRDRCGQSFTRYDGRWTVAERDGGSYITYELSVTPSFHVPGFMLRRLLKRDAVQMIQRLSEAIDARAQ